MENWDQAMAAVNEMLTVFDRRRLRLLEGLTAIDGVQCPRAQGAFYLFPNIDSFGLSANDFAARILEEQKVALVPGRASVRLATSA